MTENHGYNTPEKGSTDWHVPLNENFERLDRDIEIRDEETELSSYEPKAGAKFFAVDTSSIFIGNGESWQRVREGESSDILEITGIDTVRKHVGPLHQGESHGSTSSDWGIAFGMPDATTSITLHSCVVDVDAGSSNLDTITIELHSVASRDEFGIQTDALVDSTTTGTLSDGPNRVSLDFTIPDDDNHSEYVLSKVGEADANGNALDTRRIDTWAGWDDYEDPIDLLQGGIVNNTTANDWSANYYYFFDLEVGDETNRVRAPLVRRWDVDEIYMRPRDPEEEFDDVSPRALWIDTS